MRKVQVFVACTAAVLLAVPLAAQSGPDSNWRSILADRLPLFGHRNWIVIADSAYPAQASNGIETVVSNADPFEVLRAVLAALDRSKHVRPIVHVDEELQAVDESDASGISAYREQLSAYLGGRTVHRELHGQIISKLAEVSQSFRVLIIKTNSTLPYTSVFLELGPAYWSDDAERRLRQSLGEHSPK
jgi:hypothetical protein